MTREEMKKIYLKSKYIKDNQNKDKLIIVIEHIINGLSSNVSENIIKRQINKLLN